MKKIGIATDDYKVEMFEKKLTEAGFTDFTKSPLVCNCTTIQVNIPDDKVLEIKKICEYVELFYKKRN